jgi:protein SCO1
VIGAPHIRSLVVTAALLAPAPTSAQPAAPPPVAKIGVDERTGAKLPLEVSFTSSRGERVKLGEVLGNGTPTLLVLAYNRCSMLCSLVLRGAADLVKNTSQRLGDDFSVVTVSIDPSETPHEAARAQQAIVERAGYPGQGSRWPFLVGDKSDIDAVAGTLGFRYEYDPKTEQFAHPAVLFAIDADGKVAGTLHGIRHDPEQAWALLSGASTAASLGPASAVLNCFRFDALGRKYGPWIQRLFQAGAASVLLALGAAVVVLARRERQRKREGLL